MDVGTDRHLGFTVDDDSILGLIEDLDAQLVSPPFEYSTAFSRSS